MLSKRLKHVWRKKDIQCNAINSPQKISFRKSEQEYRNDFFLNSAKKAAAKTFYTKASAVIVIKAPIWQ
jgi:predicted negative regulator of RcsB-dependent stress response